MKELIPGAEMALPALYQVDQATARHTLEFFTVTIRIPGGPTPGP